MRGRIEDYSISYGGKQKVTFSVDGDFRELYEKYRDVDVDLSVKKWSPKRSDASNRFLWVLVDKIAVNQHITKTEVYRNAIKEIGGVSDVVCVKNEAVEKLRLSWEQNGLGWQTDIISSKIDGCTNVILYYGSSTYNVEQMMELINNLMFEAENLGINTDTPERAAYWEWVERNRK